MENLFVELATSLWHLISLILSALSPLLIGLILAYLLSPVVDRLRPKVGSVWAILLTYISLLLILGGMVYGFVILILGALPTGSWQETLDLVIDYFRSSYEAAASFLNQYIPSSLLETDNVVENIQSWFESRFSFQSIVNALSSITGGLISLFLGAVASIYLLKDKDFFLRLWNRFLSLTMKQRYHGLINETMSEINDVITTFLKGAFVDSLIVAFLSSVVLTGLQVEFSVIIGGFGGILNIIPYFGPFFGMVPAFIVAFFTDGLPKAVAAVVGLFIVQQIDCNFIYPKIVGNTTGLHPLFVLLSVSILGYFLGIIGMIIAVPAAGIVQVFVKKWAYR